MTTPIISSKYFSRAKTLFRITIFSFLGATILSWMFKGTSVNPEVADIVTGLPLLMAYILVPIGFIYLVKSYRKKEPFNRYRILYLTGYFFFLVVLAGFLIIIAGDFGLL
jgi:hypothetical protein